MKESITHIGRALKAARQNKGLSQRSLSKKVEIPQSHLSKIENGAVDLQTSSLIEISRHLDLELMLIPRILVPIIQALLKDSEHKSQKQIPLYQLDNDV